MNDPSKADRECKVDRPPSDGSRAQVVLAVLAVIAALYLLKAILIPVTFALVISCMLMHHGELYATPFSVRSARRPCAFGAVSDRRPLSLELDGREPGRSDLYFAI